MGSGKHLGVLNFQEREGEREREKEREREREMEDTKATEHTE